MNGAHAAETHTLTQHGGADDRGPEHPVSHSEWQALNQQLRDNGFSGMELATQPQQPSICMPRPRQLFEALSAVLKQYDRRAKLVQELLAATELARERETNVDAMMAHLRKYVQNAIMLVH